MREVFLAIFALIMISGNCQEKTKNDVIIKKWFKNNNTFVIVCKGYPKAGLKEPAKTESAKEAALINAQFFAKDLFTESVDVIKNGNVDKYQIKNEYVIIYYEIKASNLKKYLRKK